MTARTDDDDEGVAAFDAVCTRLGGFERRLRTEWIDGYLTALVAGPRSVLPSEWLPKMCGDAFERAFADPTDVEQAFGALMNRWNAIAGELRPERLFDDPDALRLRPVLLLPDDDDADRAELERWLGAPWADGFGQALDDFADDWRLPPSADADDAAHVAECLQAVAALLLDDAELAAYRRERYPGQQLGRDELIDEACYAVQELRMFWIDHALRPAPLRVAPKPGRNDACPCGSGKKWKKCCGAAG